MEAGCGIPTQLQTTKGPSSPTIPQVLQIFDPKIANLPRKVKEYLKYTNEDLQSIVKSQWIIDKAISNDIDFSLNDRLSVINRIIPHKDVLLASIASFIKHCETMEGHCYRDTELSKTSKGVSRSAEKFYEFRTELSTILADPTLEQNMKEAVKHLLTHLHNIYQTLDDYNQS